jgi:pyruvate formate lyase activating enzyme
MQNSQCLKNKSLIIISSFLVVCLDIVAFIPKSETHWHGKLVSVVFTPFCNFRCSFCFDYPLVVFPHKLPLISEEKFFNVLTNTTEPVDAVIVSGGEPTLQGIALKEFLKKVQDFGFISRIDTNGSNPKLLEQLLANNLLDYVSIGVHGLLQEKRYVEITQRKTNISNILKSIELVESFGIDYEIKMVFVPSFHSEEEVLLLADYLKGIKRFLLQRFDNSSGTLDKALELAPQGSFEVLKSIAKKIKGIGEVRVKSGKHEEIVSTDKSVKLRQSFS